VQDQDQDRFFWSQTGLVLKPMVSDDITGDSLSEALHLLQLQLSPPPPSSLVLVKSNMEPFQYWLTQIVVEKNGCRRPLPATDTVGGVA